jgi:hypothetical protein
VVVDAVVAAVSVVGAVSPVSGSVTVVAGSVVVSGSVAVVGGSAVVPEDVSVKEGRVGSVRDPVGRVTPVSVGRLDPSPAQPPRT